MKKIFFLFVMFLNLITLKGENKVMFYNVENFFDIYHDKGKLDYEYLKDGSKRWNYYKFRNKAFNIAKVIACVGGDKFPSLVGMSEVENENCLDYLVRQTPLKKANYNFLLYEGKDVRGIDVALLYKKSDFKLLKAEAFNVNFPSKKYRNTRNILYAKGVLVKKDTLHVFVCHFPSRLGGVKATEFKRRYASKMLYSICDSIKRTNSFAKILIMGDFNDSSLDKSLLVDLKCNRPDYSKIGENKLYDMLYSYAKNKKIGSHKYKYDWMSLDHLIISGELMKEVNEAGIAGFDFLLEEDKKYFGKKPKRTYNGYKYNDGYSDHLPIYLIIK